MLVLSSPEKSLLPATKKKDSKMFDNAHHTEAFV